jgi:hypothetical protein
VPYILFFNFSHVHTRQYFWDITFFDIAIFIEKGINFFTWSSK